MSSFAHLGVTAQRYYQRVGAWSGTHSSSHTVNPYVYFVCGTQYGMPRAASKALQAAVESLAAPKSMQLSKYARKISINRSTW